jgi:hypothetical protein
LGLDELRAFVVEVTGRDRTGYGTLRRQGCCVTACRSRSCRCCWDMRR